MSRNVGRAKKLTVIVAMCILILCAIAIPTFARFEMTDNSDINLVSKVYDVAEVTDVDCNVNIAANGTFVWSFFAKSDGSNRDLHISVARNYFDGSVKLVRRIGSTETEIQEVNGVYTSENEFSETVESSLYILRFYGGDKPSSAVVNIKIWTTPSESLILGENEVSKDELANGTITSGDIVTPDGITFRKIVYKTHSRPTVKLEICDKKGRLLELTPVIAVVNGRIVIKEILNKDGVPVSGKKNYEQLVVYLPDELVLDKLIVATPENSEYVLDNVIADTVEISYNATSNVQINNVQCNNFTASWPNMDLEIGHLSGIGGGSVANVNISTTNNLKLTATDIDNANLNIQGETAVIIVDTISSAEVTADSGTDLSFDCSVMTDSSIVAHGKKLSITAGTVVNSSVKADDVQSVLQFVSDSVNGLEAEVVGEAYFEAGIIEGLALNGDAQKVEIKTNEKLADSTITAAWGADVNIFSPSVNDVSVINGGKVYITADNVKNSSFKANNIIDIYATNDLIGVVASGAWGAAVTLTADYMDEINVSGNASSVDISAARVGTVSVKAEGNITLALDSAANYFALTGGTTSNAFTSVAGGPGVSLTTNNWSSIIVKKR